MGLIITLLCALLVFACGGKKSEGVGTVPTQRTGRSIISYEPKYRDQGPSLSADGLKLVYVTGSVDSGLRVVKTSRTAGAAFTAAERLSATSGLTSENTARISGDGNNVLLQGFTATGSALVLCNWAGTTCTTITTDPVTPAGFAFAPDSSAFYYQKGSTVSGSTTLNVATVAAPTAPVSVGASAQWSKVFWVPVASGLKLAAIEPATAAGKFNLVGFTFATVAAATGATAASIASDLPRVMVARSPLGGAAGTTAASSVLLARFVKGSERLKMLELGNVDVKVEQKLSNQVKNQLYTYSLDGSSNAAVATGFETIEGYLASDGDTIFSLERVGGRCAGESSLTNGNMLAVTSKASGSITWKYMKKPSDLSQPPLVASDFCDRVIDASTTTLELGISDFAVNAAATNSHYTLAWVSDMTGDAEVYASEVNASATLIWNVSANRKP